MSDSYKMKDRLNSEGLLLAWKNLEIGQQMSLRATPELFDELMVASPASGFTLWSY